MANYRSANVLFVDTTANFDGIYEIKAIKYMGGTAGALARIRKDGPGGAIIWDDTGTADLRADEISIRVVNGMRVEVSNTASVYIYLK